MKKEKSIQHIDELCRELMKKHGLFLSLNDMQKIRRNAITLRKLFECECNAAIREKLPTETWDEYDKNRRDYQIPWIEKRQEAVLSLIKKTLEGSNIPFYVQGDCRGCSLYLGTTSESNYSSEGVAIY